MAVCKTELKRLKATYSLSLLVGGSEFLSLVLKTAQLNFELVITAGQLREIGA